MCRAQIDTIYFAPDTARALTLGNVAVEKAKAYRYRILKREGEKYKVTDRDMDGQLVMETYSLSHDSAIFDGPYCEYYPDGVHKKTKGHYLKGNMVGQWQFRFQNMDRPWMVSNFASADEDTTKSTMIFYASGQLERQIFTIRGKDVSECYSEKGERIKCIPIGESLAIAPSVSLDEKWINFLQMKVDNLRYVYRNFRGKVYVNFMVNEDGSIEISNISGSYPSLCGEVRRIVKSMPKWKWDKQLGKPARQYFTLPIIFKL